jgi:citronellol/citronellal dehydrogenase
MTNNTSNTSNTNNTTNVNNAKKTVFITGGSRGVGLAIAKRFAMDGANIVIVAKTTEPHPKLEGTLWTAAEEIRQAGASEVLAIPCDVRNLEMLKAAIDEAGAKFGKIDCVINNASSIYLLSTEDITEKRFDLMNEIIVRASFFTAKYALPYLAKSECAHILNIAPFPDMQPKWFAFSTAYTLFKYASGGMVMGMAAEFASRNIAVNALWPSTFLDTAAVQNLLGGEKAVLRSRKPSIVADAAHIILHKPTTYSGKYHLDEDVIKEAGLDLDSYSVVPGSDLIPDLYVNAKKTIFDYVDEMAASGMAE